MGVFSGEWAIVAARVVRVIVCMYLGCITLSLTHLFSMHNSIQRALESFLGQYLYASFVRGHQERQNIRIVSILRMGLLHLPNSFDVQSKVWTF
jgi:hypothetical protein